MTILLALIIAFGASTLGGICGIGGGVIMKPLLDLIRFAPVATISFLSACTVLSMAIYNVGQSLHKGSGEIDLKSCSALAVGAAVGGILGNTLFKLFLSRSGAESLIGVVQAALLLLLLLGTMLYTLRKQKILPKNVQSGAARLGIGFALGMLSSFLGIGGGPFNLVVLHYFLGMPTKKAVGNSIFIILFSQAANILLSVCRGTVPPFQPIILILMIAGGIGGGILGKEIKERLSNQAIDTFFVLVLVLMMILCGYNLFQYLLQIS